MPDATNPVMRVVPEEFYVAALSLAHELALELRQVCPHHDHYQQIAEIEARMEEAGVKLPGGAFRRADDIEGIRAMLNPQTAMRVQRIHHDEYYVERTFYQEQKIAVSEKCFARCDVGLSIKLDHVHASLTRKESGYGKGYVLVFAFAELLNA